MLEKEHLVQKTVDNQSEEMHLEGAVQPDEGKVVTIKDVVKVLNDQQSVEEVADKLNMRVNVLAAKLANAAVKLDDDGNWTYLGENESDSLARNIYKKIYVKSYDREYVSMDDESKDDQEKGTIADLDYELYKDSLNVKATLDKKSVLFEEGIYEKLKELSQKKSIKMSNLINTLIKKGLDYYGLK